MVTFMGYTPHFQTPLSFELKMTILEVHGGFWDGWLCKKKTRRGDEWGQFGVNHHFLIRPTHSLDFWRSDTQLAETHQFQTYMNGGMTKGWVTPRVLDISLSWGIEYHRIYKILVVNPWWTSPKVDMTLSVEDQSIPKAQFIVPNISFLWFGFFHS